MNDRASPGTITRLIAEHRAGDRTKSNEIFHHYFELLSRFASRLFDSRKSGRYDHEDIAISVLAKLYEDPDLYEVTDRKELLRLLCRMARNRIISQQRKDSALKRGSGRTIRLSELSESELEDLRNMRDSMEDPHSRAVICEQLNYLKSKHEDKRLDEICEGILLGYTYDEIAQRLKLSERSVSRKVKLIRSIWLETLNAEEKRRSDDTA